MYIHSNNIYTPTGCIDAIMHIENGKIIEFLDSKSNVVIDLECNDLRVIPGIIDTRNHGTMGFTLMGKYDQKEDLVRGYLKGLASQGVTACMPTAEVEYFKAIVQVCKEEIVEAEATTKECPFCCSTIAINAKRCPNCTSELG